MGRKANQAQITKVLHAIEQNDGNVRAADIARSTS